MADKIQTGISVNKEVARQAKEVGQRMRWDTFSQIVEMGLELFIEKYGAVSIPGLTDAPPTLVEFEADKAAFAAEVSQVAEMAEAA